MKDNIFNNIENFTEKIQGDSRRSQVIGSLGAIAGIGSAILAASGVLEIIGLSAATAGLLTSAYSIAIKQKRDSLLDALKEIKTLNQEIFKHNIEIKLLERHSLDLSIDEVNEIKNSILQNNANTSLNQPINQTANKSA